MPLAGRHRTVRNRKRGIDFGHPECRRHFSQGADIDIYRALLNCSLARLVSEECLETRALLGSG